MRNAIKMLGLVSLLALSACGGGEGGEFDQFVGTWRATSGSVTRVCPGGSPSTEAVTGNVIWINGVTSDLVATSVLTPCRLQANVIDATASGVPGPGCTQSEGVDGRVTVTFASYAFVVSSDGRTAAEVASGQVTHIAQGSAISCSFDESASYEGTRI